MSNHTNEKKHPLMVIGGVLMAAGVVMALSHIEASGDVLQFLAAAAPWLLLGSGVACTLAGAAAGQKKER